MSDDSNVGTRELGKALDVIESSVGRVEKRLDRIEQLIRDQGTESASGRRVELKRWTSSVATKVGIRLLRTLAKEAVPKNGELPQAARKEGINSDSLSDSRCTFRSARNMQS